GGREEMRACDILRTLCLIRHDVDIDARGVAEEKRTGLHRGVDLLPHLLLHRDLLEHRLDDEIAVSERIVIGDRLDAREALLHLFGDHSYAITVGLSLRADTY